MARALLVGTVLAFATPVRADAPTTEPTATVGPTTTRRLAAIGAAIVPGIIVRGAGSWVIGEKPAAKRLAATAGIGLGAIVIGGAAVGSVVGASAWTGVANASTVPTSSARAMQAA